MPWFRTEIGLAALLAFGPLVYRAMLLPHRMIVQLSAWSFCLAAVTHIVWSATSRAARGSALYDQRRNLTFEIPLVLLLACGPDPYQILQLPHFFVLGVLSHTLSLAVIGHIIWLLTQDKSSSVALTETAFRPGVSSGVVAGAAYLAIVLFMWSPFAFTSGMGYETGFPYNSETVRPWWNGFWDEVDAMRPYTNFFYHASYLIGEASRIPGSFAPYQFVYAALWWARGLLVFLILRRVLRGYDFVCYLAGALVLVHASDNALGWVGQLNQFGFIFWMLLAIYLLIRAIDGSTYLECYIYAVAACFAQYLSLWSYESGIFIVLAAPLLILAARRPTNLRIKVISGAWYCISIIYLVLSVKKYLQSAGASYQEAVMRKNWALTSLASDLLYKLTASVSFWTWKGGLPHDVPPEVITRHTNGAVAAFVVGGLVIFLLRRRRDSMRAFIPMRILAALAGAGGGVLLLSFPAYLVLDSSSGLWRTQMLSGIGTGILLAAVPMLLANALGVISRNRTWISAVASLTAASYVVSCGASRAIERQSAHRIVWEKHRQVIAAVLRAAPQIKPGTVVVLTNVVREEDPFGDTMWFDLALRLAYPGEPIAGSYFLADGKPAPGNTFQLKNERWTAGEVGYRHMFMEAPVADSVLMEYGRGEAHILAGIPAFVCERNCGAGQYGPERRVVHGMPSVRAINRYGPL